VPPTTMSESIETGRIGTPSRKGRYKSGLVAFSVELKPSFGYRREMVESFLAQFSESTWRTDSVRTHHPARVE